MKTLIASTSAILIALSISSVALADDAQVHGFVSQAFLYATKNKYMAPDVKKGSFEFNEFGFNVSKNVTDDLRVGMQIFARDLGEFGNDTVTVDWAYGDYRWRPWLGVRIGKIKLPVGMYNEVRDIDAARTGVFLPQSVYAEAYREALIATQGAALYGRIPLGPLGSLPYQLLAGSVSFPPGGATETTFNAIIGGAITVKPSSNVPNFTGYIEWETPLNGLRLAFSELYTYWDQVGKTNVDIPTPTGQTIPAGTPVKGSISSLHIETYSVEFIWRNLTMAGEYIRRRPKLEMDLDLSAAGLGMIPLPMQLTSEDGFYVSASYRLTDWFEVGSYFAGQYAEASTHSTENVNDFNHDIDLSLRFDLPGGFIVKAEAHKMYGAKGVIYDLGTTERDWWFFAGKASFSF